jgi:hypothetical protein
MVPHHALMSKLMKILANSEQSTHIFIVYWVLQNYVTGLKPWVWVYYEIFPLGAISHPHNLYCTNPGLPVETESYFLFSYYFLVFSKLL